MNCKTGSSFEVAFRITRWWVSHTKKEKLKYRTASRRQNKSEVQKFWKTSRMVGSLLVGASGK